MMIKNLLRRNISSQTKTFLQQEAKFNGGKYYNPLPIVIEKAKGVYAWDVDGKRYIDFLAGYGSLNHGHCHPKIYKAVEEQTNKLTVLTIKLMDDQNGPYEKMLSETFGQQKVLLQNSGSEACDVAMKFCRRWGTRVKGIENEKVTILMASGSSFGNHLSAIAGSDNPLKYERFGPSKNLGFDIVEYNNTSALEQKLKGNPNIAAFMLEPIQASQGCIIPCENYLRKCREICDKYNVLLIFDEVFTGLGRTGKLLACDYEGVKPDALVLGKSLSGGFYPISACLAKSEILELVEDGCHGSTYSLSTLACAIGQASLKVLKEEGIVENSGKRGTQFLNLLKQLNLPFIKDIRGKGLMVAIEFDEDNWEYKAQDVVVRLVENGILVRQANDSNIVQFTPPLVITEDEINSTFDTIQKVLSKM